MNWSVFYFAGFVGVTAGMLFRRRQSTQAELWIIVIARVTVALLLAVMVPAGESGPPATSTTFVVLGVSEAGRAIETMVSTVVDRHLVRREARKWLPR